MYASTNRKASKSWDKEIGDGYDFSYRDKYAQNPKYKIFNVYYQATADLKVASIKEQKAIVDRYLADKKNKALLKTDIKEVENFYDEDVPEEKLERMSYMLSLGPRTQTSTGKRYAEAIKNAGYDAITDVRASKGNYKTRKRAGSSVIIVNPSKLKQLPQLADFTRNAYNSEVYDIGDKSKVVKDWGKKDQRKIRQFEHLDPEPYDIDRKTGEIVPKNRKKRTE